jgi:hypothetical protein
MRCARRSPSEHPGADIQWDAGAMQGPESLPDDAAALRLLSVASGAARGRHFIFAPQR